MEGVKAVRAYLHIAYDTFHDDIVVYFKYLDRSDNIPS